MMLRSILLPLSFSYSATILLREESSSLAKPWTHHISAVVAAALAMYGRASALAAASPTELRSTERRVNIVTLVFLPCLRSASERGRVLVVVSLTYYRARARRAQTLISSSRSALDSVIEPPHRVR